MEQLGIYTMKVAGYSWEESKGPVRLTRLWERAECKEACTMCRNEEA